MRYIKKTYIGAGELFLTISLVSTACFCFWIVSKDDDDLVHDALKDYGRMVVFEKRSEGYTQLQEILANQPDGPLDPIWLQLVRINRNGYEKLGYYLRILEDDTERKLTYREIANFLELAPDVFHDEVKDRYLGDMSRIPGIRRDWLEEYGLSFSPNNT